MAKSDRLLEDGKRKPEDGRHGVGNEKEEEQEEEDDGGEEGHGIGRQTVSCAGH